MLASRGLLPAIRGLAAVRWDIGVKPHAVQTVKVDLTERRTFPKWHRATPLAALMAERAVAPSGEVETAQQQAGLRPTARPQGPTEEQAKQRKKIRQAAIGYWCAEAWSARRSQWQ